MHVVEEKVASLCVEGPIALKIHCPSKVRLSLLLLGPFLRKECNNNRQK